MKKTFRGQLAPGSIERIRLSTNNGLTGYKMHKFQVLESAPGTLDSQTVAQIFTTENSDAGLARTASATVNFTDPTLLAALYQKIGNSGGDPAEVIVIFDNMTVNQDIFITMADAVSNTAVVNYYIELEQVKLSDNEATVATLKDMRAGPDTNFGP